MPRSTVRASLALLCLLLTRFRPRRGRYPPVPAFGDPALPVDLSGEVTLQNCVAQALGRNFTSGSSSSACSRPWTRS
jgi:hypothetical protein